MSPSELTVGHLRNLIDAAIQNRWYNPSMTLGELLETYHARLTAAQEPDGS